MVSTKNLISSNIANQVPSFIADEYPLFVDFIQTYYQGQESSGQPLDLVNNLLEYLDVDVLQSSVKEFCTTSTSISISDSEIRVDSTEGFPEKDGLIKINSEIILYKTKTNTTFEGCSRGVSGATKVGLNFEYTYSQPSTHPNNSKVINLSYLFLLYYFSKIKSNYLPFFNQSLANGINVSTFIKNIKQFYNSKGTSKSFDFIIRALFNVKNQTLYPRERLLKSSDAIFSSPTIIRCLPISSNLKDNPKYLSGQQLYQTKIDRDPDQSEIVGELVSYTVTLVEESFDYNGQIYQLSVDKTNSNLDINLSPKTKLITNITSQSNNITVDSTIGFPRTDGYLKIGSEFVKYSEKTLNQFLNCQRGYAGTDATAHSRSEVVETTQLLYGYSNEDPTYKIFIFPLGIVSNYDIVYPGKNYNVGDKVSTESLGYSDDDQKSKNWIINYPTPPNNNIVNFFQSIFCDVTSVYKNSDGYFIASSGVPSHTIGAGFTQIGNQRHLKKIPSQITTTQLQKISQTNRDSAIFLNGVTLQSPISEDVIYYGNITSFNILNNGKNYGVGRSGGPTIIVTPNSNGSGVTTTAKALIDGRVVSAKVLNGGSGYTEDAIAQVVGSNGDGATIDLVINNGAIIDAIVTNSGSGYNFLPEVNIVGSPGNGAIIALEVSGPISEVYNLNDGLTYGLGISTRTDNYNLSVGRDKIEIYTRNYTDLLDVEYDPQTNSRYVSIYTRGSNPNNAPKLNLVSTGTTNIYDNIPVATIFGGDGATAYPIIENGRIVNVEISSSGYGYNCSPKVFVNDSTGLGFGAEIYANIENGSITSFTVLNSGVNYTNGKTSISIVPSGEDAVIIPIIKGWVKDNYKKYQTLLDSSNGYLYDSLNIRYGKRYSYIANPKQLRLQLDDNINSNLTENPTKHSKIIGWSYDGHPIYGPYGSGQTNASAFDTNIQRMVSRYSLKNSRINGPDVDRYPIGTFIDDYELNANGNLDEYNGRYCNTPEFPNGVYAYFTTINSDGTPQFPYVIGPKYNSIPDIWNFGRSNQDSLPLDVLRYRDSFLNSDTFPSIGKLSDITVSSINSNSSSRITGFNILNSGTGYSVNDRLLFNNNNTGGYGSSAKISEVNVDGGITSINLISGGNYYEELPTFLISSTNGNFSDIVPTTDFIGSVKSLKIEDVGYDYPSDYTLNPEIKLPQILNLQRTYSIKDIKILNPGSGYLFEPEVVVSGFSGTGVSAVASVSNGVITKVVVNDGGYGFSGVPTISTIKKYPFTINSFNSTLVFDFPVADYFSTGTPVTISSSSNQLPSIGSNINPISSSTIFYVINTGVDNYSIRLATSLSNAQSNTYVTFNNIGSNLNLNVSNGNATFEVSIYTPDYYVGEKITQGNFASGIVSEYKKDSKVLKLINVVGNFKEDNTPIIGEISKTKSYIYSKLNGFGKVKILPVATKLGEFLTETGSLNNSSQLTIDSNYYQNYSYVLKNKIDYSKWVSSVKNIVHPTGFALFGEKIVYSNISSSISGVGLGVNLSQNIYNEKSIYEIPNYLISDPQYGTNIVNSLNKKLSSYEVIKTSLVERFDDIGDGIVTYVGSGKTYLIPQKYAIFGNSPRVLKEDIDVYVNNSIISPEFWQLRYNFVGENISGSSIILNNNLTNLDSVKLIFNGLEFDGIDREFDLTINNSTEFDIFKENQVLIYLNQILQENNSYTISTGNTKTYVNFSEDARSNTNRIRIFGLPNLTLSQVIVSTGSSSYNIGSGYSASTSLVSYDGIILDNTDFTIQNQFITFAEPLEENKLINLIDLKQNLVSKEQISIQGTGSTFFVSNQILDKEKTIIVVNGTILDSIDYNISTGNTKITVNDSIESNSSVTVYNLSSTPNLYYEKYSIFSGESVNVSNFSGFLNNLKYRLNTNNLYSSYLVVVDNILQIPGENYSYFINSTNTAGITFTEAPKERTKFLGFLYRRKDSSSNAILNNISKSYLQYSNYIGPSLSVGSYIQEENSGTIAIVEGYNLSTNTIIFNSISSGQSFSTGSTIVGVGTTTTTATYISGTGITSGITSISVGSTNNFSTNDYALINAEIVKINSISSNLFNVSRERLGTTAPIFHPTNTSIIKLNTSKFIPTNIYTGFNTSKINFSMSTGASTIDYISDNVSNLVSSYALNYGLGLTNFSLEQSTLDVYNKDNQQSLFTVINGVVQKCQSGSGSSGFSGSYVLSGSNLNFLSSSDAPREGSSFYSRYFGKLRRLKDISYLFDGVRSIFSMDIGGDDESIPYSIETSNGQNPSNNLIIYINDVFQTPNDSFTIIGNLIIFSSPPAANSSFTGFVYIGSDDDVNSFNITPEIEINDSIFVDTEVNSRSVISLRSSSSILTSSYNSVRGEGATGVVNVSNGKITGVTITNQGSNYTESPILWFVDSTGVGAQAHCNVVNGRVTDVFITNPGSNYSNSPIVIFGKSLSLTKLNPIRITNLSKNKKIIQIASGVTFGSTTIPLKSVENLPSSGTILVVDQNKEYTHSELVTYGSISSGTTSLTNCSRRLNINFDKILLTSPISPNSISIGDIIDNNNTNLILGSNIFGSISGATGRIILIGTGDSVGTGNSLLFIKQTSPSNFQNNEVISIQNDLYRVLDSNYENTYYSYESGVEIISE